MTIGLASAPRLTQCGQAVASWRLADDIQAWVSATRSTLPGFEPQPDVEEWLAWAEAYADRIDTARHPTGMPPRPKATPEALRPFLGNISPYGPPAC